jgi:hypothetical protein
MNIPVRCAQLEILPGMACTPVAHQRDGADRFSAENTAFASNPCFPYRIARDLLFPSTLVNPKSNRRT